MTEKYYKENAIIEAVANRISEWFDVSNTASYALIETALDDIASKNIFFMADLLDKAYEQGKQDAKEENGETLVSRPRFFILAAGEWFLYLMNVAVDVILYISIGLYILGL